MKKCNKKFDWNGAEMICVRRTIFNWHYGCCRASITKEELDKILNKAFYTLYNLKHTDKK